MIRRILTLAICLGLSFSLSPAVWACGGKAKPAPEPGISIATADQSELTAIEAARDKEKTQKVLESPMGSNQVAVNIPGRDPFLYADDSHYLSMHLAIVTLTTGSDHELGSYKEKLQNYAMAELNSFSFILATQIHEVSKDSDEDQKKALTSDLSLLKKSKTKLEDAIKSGDSRKIGRAYSELQDALRFNMSEEDAKAQNVNRYIPEVFYKKAGSNWSGEQFSFSDLVSSGAVPSHISDSEINSVLTRCPSPKDPIAISNLRVNDLAANFHFAPGSKSLGDLETIAKGAGKVDAASK